MPTPLARLQELFREGSLRVITPADTPEGQPIGIQTLIQLDGDVITWIHPDWLGQDQDLQQHFQQVHQGIDGCRQVRRRLLLGLSIPPLSLGIWQGVELWQHWQWQAIPWWHLIGVLLPLLMGLCLRWLVEWLLRYLLRGD